MAKRAAVPVSERALMQRLNRVLKADGEMVKKTRGGRAQLELGTYYLLNCQRNFVTAKDIDLESYGREYKVLADWEAVVE